MKKNISAGLLILTLLSLNLQIAFAKTLGDWKDLSIHVNNEVAVQPVKGKTVFGKITSVSDSEIVLQVATKKELTNQTVTMKKDEVKKVWTANLRFKDKRAVSTGIGAAVGAGAGGGIAVGLLSATGGSDGYAEIIATFIVVGAGIGALAGFAAGRSGHEKLALVYEV